MLIFILCYIAWVKNLFRLKYIILFSTFYLFTSCNSEENLVFQTGLTKQNIDHDGLKREFNLYVPTIYSSSLKHPILFNLHGGASTAQEYMEYVSDMRSIAENENFILVYPQATSDSSGDPTWHLGGENSKSTEVDDVGFIGKIIDDLSSIYSIDQTRIYVIGFSNGAYLAYEIGCLMNDKIAGIGVVAGHMFIDTFNSCSPSHPTPIINIHGTEDFYNGIGDYYISQQNSNDYWSKINSTDSLPIISQIDNINTSDGSTVELHSWKNGTNGTTVEHYKIIGGGHSWPKINPNSSKGYTNGDIDADQLIWNYLSRYNLDGLR